MEVATLPSSTVFSHCGLPNNEMADRLASRTVESDLPDTSQVWITDFVAATKRHLRAEFRATAPQTSHRYDTYGSSFTPKEQLLLPKKIYTEMARPAGRGFHPSWKTPQTARNGRKPLLPMVQQKDALHATAAEPCHAARTRPLLLL